MCAAGCSRHTTIPSGQVIARIGNEVVTTLELNNELRAANLASGDRKDPALVERTLRELTLRKYLVQQATLAKLQQQPDVLYNLLRSREQVLAAAVLERGAANISVAQSDIDKFIVQHPDKFASRRILAIEQIRFPIGDNIHDIVAAIEPATSLEDIDRKLTMMGIAHSRSTGEISGGDVPQDLAKALAVRKPTEIFFRHLGPNAVYFKVHSETPAPLEGAAAADVARQILKTDLLNDHIAAAWTAARREVRFSVDYAKMMDSDDGSPQAPGAATAASDTLEQRVR
jgi:EpsD family peptidyl-prolyl cis-trans isomerase